MPGQMEGEMERWEDEHPILWNLLPAIRGPINLS